MSRRAGQIRLFALVVLALVACVSPARAAKTDVVVMRNGDTLTGEVDVLERGRLRFKTDDMGTLDIEWDKVRHVTAGATFEIEAPCRRPLLRLADHR